MKRVIFLFLFVSLIFAQSPRTLAFWAQLRDDTGAPLTGPVDVVISLYESADGGDPVHTETHTVTPDVFGDIAILLGEDEELDIPFDRPYFVGLRVRGEDMSSRLPLSSSPYSLSSVNTVMGVSPEDGDISFTNSDGISWEADPATGEITANYTGPGGHRAVYGDSENNGAVQVNSTAGTPVVVIESTPGPSQGMSIVADNPDSSVLTVRNQSTTSSFPVVTIETNSTDYEGSGLNVYSTGGFGIEVEHAPTEEGGVGIYQVTDSETRQAYGIGAEMYSNADSSTAIAGLVGGEAGATFGVYGATHSLENGAAGVLGLNPSEHALHPVGVKGEVRGGNLDDDGMGGYGVHGRITDGYGAGVYGESASEEVGAYGVVGISKNDIGVMGISMSSEEGAIGVAGTVEPEGDEYGAMAIGVLGEMYADSDSSIGVYGITGLNDALTFGVVGQTGSSADGAAGVYGTNYNSSAINPVGVVGKVTATEYSTDGSAGVKGIVSVPAGFGFGVYGEANVSGDEAEGAGVYGYSSRGYGIAGEIDTEEDDFAAVYGATAHARTYGVIGETYSESDSTVGVYGIAAGSGVNFGVIGHTMSSSDHASGVLGIAEGNGSGVTGYAKGTEAAGVGVYGYTKEGFNTPILGENESDEEDACGVVGASLSETGTKYGVAGQITSTDGAGVYGVSYSMLGTAPGVYGESGSIEGLGVHGKGFTGVYAEGTHKGIIASAEADSGYAIEAIGRVIVNDGINNTLVVDPFNSSLEINNAMGMPLTVFGGPTNRVAIQQVNGGATPTIPDNNFTITGEYPISVTTGDHGVTISCEDCGGGGGGFDCLTCDGGNLTTTGDFNAGGELNIDGPINTEMCVYAGGTLNSGGDGLDGSVRVNQAGGHYNHLFDAYGVSSQTGGSFEGDLHVAGDVYGASKHFVAPHPEQPGMEIVFTSTESDQVNIEHNGRVELTDGYAEYELPREFILMAEEGTYSVIATAQSIETPANIGADITQDGRVRIRNFEGTDLSVAFRVTAIRKGYKDYPVVREHNDNPFGRPEATK